MQQLFRRYKNIPPFGEPFAMFRTICDNDVELKTNTAANEPGFIIYLVWNGGVEGGGYFTTDGQSVSISWYRASLWDLRPDITSCRYNVAVLSLWGALSDERTSLLFAV
jgi:hypothetical protein